MPAAVAKGIIISLSIIAALSIAVLESPQVQSWLEEQRRKITELLRSGGGDLDPESRRRAEAFAYEGRSVPNDQESQRQASRDLDAVARATGREISSSNNMRRIPITGPKDPNEAEERKRKGREYLAKRNQQMIEMRERQKASKPEVATSPPTPTSFDAMVDSSGNLREASLVKVVSNPIPEPVQEEMKEVERHLKQPILTGEPSAMSASGWQMGSEVANPFGDEYALDRSITPRPAPFPERALDVNQQSLVEENTNIAGLTYEEQLAIAMSLSEQDSVENAATVRQKSAKEEIDLRRAIRASLKDLDGQEAAHAVSHDESTAQNLQPLVDLTPPVPLAPTPRRHDWDSHFRSNLLPMQFSSSHNLPKAPPSETTDELYSITPELTRARLASFDAQQNASASASTVLSNPFRHGQEEATNSGPVHDAADFFSATSVISPPPSSHTLDNEVPQLIDINDFTTREGAQTPTSRTFSPTGFSTNFGSETLEQPSGSDWQIGSQAQSEISNADVVMLEDDSDVDMLSEEGDGIATPDSWSEVGSKDAESETEDVTRPLQSGS